MIEIHTELLIHAHTYYYMCRYIFGFKYAGEIKMVEWRAETKSGRIESTWEEFLFVHVKGGTCCRPLAVCEGKFCD